MRSIAIANSKGGTGKTTSARQIASELGKSCRVLLVDLDPQASLTDILDLEGRQVFTIAHAFDDQKRLADVLTPITDTISLAAANDDLLTIEQRLREREGTGFTLARMLDTVKDRFDFVVIDTIGATDRLITNAILAADAVLIPARPETTDRNALGKFLAFVEYVLSIPGAKTAKVGILPTQYVEQIIHHRQALEVIRATGYMVFTPIGRSVKISEANEERKPLAEFDASNPRAMEYATVTKELIHWLSQ